MTPERREALKALDRLTDEQLHDIIHRMSQDPRALRSEGFKGWWRRWAGTIAFLTLILVTTLGFARVEGIANDAKDAADKAETAAVEAKAAVAAAEAERAARVDTVSGVISLGCRTDNEQDLLLGELVGISVEGANREELTPKERKALDTFLTAQQELTDTAPCKEIVVRYQKGEKVPRDPDRVEELSQGGKAGDPAE